MNVEAVKMSRDVVLFSLNLSTLLACTVLKLPQIALLTRTKSPKGISVRAIVLELSGYIVLTTYEMYHEYPLATYLEYPALIAQDTVLFLLILHYSGNLRQSLVYSLIYPLRLSVFVGGSQLLTLKSWIIDSAMSLCTVISATSRFAQLQCLWETKDAGQVSALSWAMSTYTCMARILTTVLTSGDLKVLLRFVVMTTLNGWVLATVVFYKRNGQKLE
ncbi:solute carrier family 66 member 3-like [Hoplias malabaricus]|uniref:solute carrier family 66 member 3-like n=1 Tax=Hoplias malabaricus TaxID=27720 RepID=UPI0034631987